MAAVLRCFLSRPALLAVAVPTCSAVLYALVGLEMIGVEIENPFGHDYNDLPLDSITDDTIGANLLELLKRHDDGGAAPTKPSTTPPTDTVVPVTD